MKRIPEGSRVYSSWDEAMADSDLDLSRPWFVVPEPVAEVEPFTGWPDGWTEIGAAEDR